MDLCDLLSAESSDYPSVYQDSGLIMPNSLGSKSVLSKYAAGEAQFVLDETSSLTLKCQSWDQERSALLTKGRCALRPPTGTHPFQDHYFHLMKSGTIELRCGSCVATPSKLPSQGLNRTGN